MSPSARTGRRVVVVTGGGGGIGAAIAEELGRRGAFVVTLDPLVTLDGSAQLPAPEETTAGRIVAAGGTARASSASVTDGDAVRGLFEELVDEHGRLDGVINVAGITRPTHFAEGSEDDWVSVLSVHLDGYLNVLNAALPIMSAAGHGRVVGVTSGSGWRPADAGGYSCAKRAVAALTWQLGPTLPRDVIVNAISPIAVTRMVTAAIARAGGAGAGGTRASGGISLGSMPQPEDLGPLGAHLVGQEFTACNGQVIFAGGSEVAIIERPRLLEVVRTDDVASLATLLEAVASGALAPAEAKQVSGGGGNPRFDHAFEAPAGELPAPAAETCVVVTDRRELGAAVTASLEGRGVSCTTIDASKTTAGFDGAADALASAVERAGPIDGVVLALRGSSAAGGARGRWERILTEHGGLAEQIHADAAWARAATDYATRADRPIRLVTLTDAVNAGGRSRAQASAQLARAAARATEDRVAAFAVSVETDSASGVRSVGEVAAHLVCSPDAPALRGAELVAAASWFGLRTHPRPSTSITLGGTEIPDWLDSTLRSVVGARGDEA
jgi:NAD(P)-dependent dehydrogenase (short-subunit alcohol dehydrogenase family)